jgi:sterol desaturase/sphingolipid hydroxylase (fatty acid hydroxylase superfamily)
MEYPNLIHWAIPGFIVLLLVEVGINAWDHRHLFKTKDTLASLSMGIGNVLIGLVTKTWIFLAYSFVWQFKIVDLGTEWWTWVLLFFAEDLTYYVFHRVSHESRFFWASHVVHHSSEYYNLGTALRQTWTGSLYTWVFWLWLPFVGFHPMMIMMMQSISLIYQFWIHTEVIHKLPRPIEWFFNTPSHHRVHHASNAQYLDRNHAGVLIIWDRLFGTFVPEDVRPTYGLTKNLNTYNPLVIAFHEWRDMLKDVLQPGLTIKQRWMYLFGPPGWSHDGSRKTSEMIRKEWREKSEAGL